MRAFFLKSRDLLSIAAAESVLRTRLFCRLSERLPPIAIIKARWRPLSTPRCYNAYGTPNWVPLIVYKYRYE